MTFDYFYGSQSESFSFYRIPRCLITDPAFRGLSSDAKLLYGLLLDRMGLSARNGWYDDQNRVFIYYTLEEIGMDLNCGHDKATKLLRELDTETGIGLIERVKQGLGKPTRIYVKAFSSARDDRTQDCGDSAPKTAEKPQSGPRETSSQDCDKPAGSYIDNNYTEENYTDFSYIHPSIHQEEGETDRCGPMEIVHEQIEYDVLINDRRARRETLDGLAFLIRDVRFGNQASFRINRADVPGSVVQGVFAKITREHVEYVLDCMDTTATEITSIRSYLLTALYNAVLHMDSHIGVQVRYDMRC